MEYKHFGERGARMSFDLDMPNVLVITDKDEDTIGLNDEETRKLVRLLVKAYLKD